MKQNEADRVRNRETALDFAKKGSLSYHQTKDPSKSSVVHLNSYDREQIRAYLKAPTSNEANIRAVAKYLYYRSQAFNRIVNWYASMWDLSCRKVIPNYTLHKTPNANKLIKQYEATLDQLDIYNLQGNLYGALVRAYLFDLTGGIFFRDDTGAFLYLIDTDELKIDGFYMDGSVSVAVDMSKWRNKDRQQLIEWLGEPLNSMWNEYQSSGNRYVHIPDEYNFALKFRIDDLNSVISPFAPLLQSFGGLNDLADIQALADEASIYKLLLVPMKALSGAKQSDTFEFSPDLILQYYDRLLDHLPDYVAAAPVIGEITNDDVISFEQSTRDKDVDRLEQSQSQVLATAGGGAVLNANNITSTAAFTAWLKAESEFAISALRPQIEGITNRMLSFDVSNPCKVEYFEVSVYTKEELRKSLLESCQYSFANRLAYNTFLGISEKTTLAMNYFENEVLKLPEKMIYPLSSSYTNAGTAATGDEGRPKIPDEELSNSGERTRNE